MKPNIGIVNALIRITCGFTMLAWATAKLTKRPWRDRYILVAMLGGMKVGEGMTRYCPITDVLIQNREHRSNDQEEGINPS